MAAKNSRRRGWIHGKLEDINRPYRVYRGARRTQPIARHNRCGSRGDAERSRESHFGCSAQEDRIFKSQRAIFGCAARGIIRSSISRDRMGKKGHAPTAIERPPDAIRSSCCQLTPYRFSHAIELRMADRLAAKGRRQPDQRDHEAEREKDFYKSEAGGRPHTS